MIRQWYDLVVRLLISEISKYGLQGFFYTFKCGNTINESIIELNIEQAEQVEQETS